MVVPAEMVVRATTVVPVVTQDQTMRPEALKATVLGLLQEAQQVYIMQLAERLVVMQVPQEQMEEQWWCLTQEWK
jgi:hypothetical protein